MNVTIEIQFNKIKDADKNLIDGINRGMDDLVDFIFAKSQELVAVDEATLKKSGHLERQYLLKSVEYDAPHASFIEYGTRPHFPPVEPLAAWAVRVLQIPKKEAMQVGYMICRKIAANGTEPQPFLRPAADEGKMKAPAIIRNAMKK